MMMEAAEEQLRRLHLATGRSPAVPKSALKRSSCIGDSSSFMSSSVSGSMSSSYELSSHGPAAIYGTMTKTTKKAVVFPDYVKGGSDDEGDGRHGNGGHFDFYELNGSPGGRKLHAYSVSSAEHQRRLMDDKQLPSSKLLNAQLKSERIDNKQQQQQYQPVQPNGVNDSERPSSYYSNVDDDDASNDLQHQQAIAAATNGEKIEHYDNFPAERAVVQPATITSTLTDEEVRQIELFYHGLRSHVYVCSCLAELYLPISMLPANEITSPSSTSGNGTTTGVGWKCGTDELRFIVAGIPVWLVNDRSASHADRHQSDPSTISIILAEKGTGFSLWKHAVRSWQLYRRVDQTFYVIHPPPTGDTGRPPFVAGLNFFEIAASNHFHDSLRTLMMSDNMGSLTRSTARMSKNALSAADKGRQRLALPKSSISSPCLFAHVTNVDKIRWRKSDQSLMATSKLTADQSSEQVTKRGKTKTKQHKRSSSHQGEILFRSQVDAKRSNSVDRQRK